MIEIEQLKKTFGTKVAVDIAQCTLGDGEMIGLLGNNGAGKTTLFRALLDLLRPDEGSVCIDGQNVRHNEQWKDFTAAYLDESFLIDYLTPEEYFDFLAKIYRLSDDDMQTHLNQFDTLMNGEILGQHKYIRNFSAGNKQKIGIIGAMLNRPRILILDEPFNYLDPRSQSAIKHLLKRYHEDTGATVIVSSHNLNHTIDLSRRILLMENGHIIRDLTNDSPEVETELNAYFEVTP